jgi:hypothetical protein
MKTKRTLSIVVLLLSAVSLLSLSNESEQKSNLLLLNMEALTQNEFDGFEQGFVTDSKWVDTGEYEYIYGYLGGVYVPKQERITCCRMSNPGSACNVASLGTCP